MLFSCMAVVVWPYGIVAISRYETLASPYNAGTEHVRVSPARQTVREPSVKLREEFSKPHKG